MPSILTDRGKTIYSMTGDEGKYNTKIPAQELHQEASNLYQSTLGELIKNSDSAKVTLPLNAIQERAIAYARDYNATSGDIASAISKIKSEFTSKGEFSLPDRFSKEGIPVSAAEAEKTGHWNEINWNKFGGRTTPDNIYNSAMGHAYQGAVETSLEKTTGLPTGTIKNMNIEIGKLRQTGDFLQQIHGDKPAIQPSKTTGATILRTGLKVGGAAVGEAAVGGITGGIGGYILARPIADAITNYLTKLPETMRNKIMRKMTAEQPEIATQIKEYLTSTTKGGNAPVESRQLPPTLR